MSALPADRAPDMLGEAMALADLGFRVIPIKPGGKSVWNDTTILDLIGLIPRDALLAQLGVTP